MPRLSDSAAAALGVAPGVEHDAGFIDYKAEEIAKGVAWLLRDAAKKRRNRRLWTYFQLALWIGVVIIVLCAVNGVWWPFWYATLPITAPLFLLFYVFSAVTITPIMVVIMLLVFITIKLDSRK